MRIGVPPVLDVWRPTFWTPSVDKVTFICQVSNEAVFRAAAEQHGIDPDKAGFAVWKRPKPWYWQDRIFLKFNTQEVLAHEVKHLIVGDFHG